MKHEINTTDSQEAALTEVVAWRNAALVTQDPGAEPFTNTTYLQALNDEMFINLEAAVAADAENQLLLKYRTVPEDGKAAIDATADVEVAKVPEPTPIDVIEVGVGVGGLGVKP